MGGPLSTQFLHLSIRSVRSTMRCANTVLMLCKSWTDFCAQKGASQEPPQSVLALALQNFENMSYGAMFTKVIVRF